ncbi:MAG: hypothetical protein ACI9MR_001775 [Myxococcota bacterium]|jgi:hypothetical protein
MSTPVSLLRAVALAALCAAPVHAGNANDGDLVLLDGGDAQVSLIGLLQGQVAPFVGADALLDNGDVAEREGFRLRRARLGFAGVAYGLFDFELSMQATPDGVDLLDAWASYRGFTSLELGFGVRKVPYSRFAMVGRGDGALADRPLAVQGMAPLRQLGLTVSGDIGGGLLGFSVGAYNGFTRSESFAQGYLENNGLDGNRFSNLAYVGRLDLSPFGPVGKGLADIDKESFRAALGGSFYFDDGASIQTLGFEVDLLIKISGLHFAAEFLYDSAEPTDDPVADPAIAAETTRIGTVVELGYMILASELGVTVRGELIDDNTDVDNAGDQLIVAGGVQYYLRRHHVKAALEYSHRTERNGVSLDNDALFLQLQFAL